MNIIITATPSEGSIDVDKEIIRVCEVLNSKGHLASSSDTAAYGFESVPSAPNGIPDISWLNTYNNATGVLRLTFSSTNMGVKITPFSNYYIKTVPNTWYTVRIRLTCNATSQNNTFSPSVFAYNGIPPSPTEVSGMVAFSIPTTWTWFECPIFTTGSSLYPQFILKNLTTSLRNLYVDDIQVIEKKPAIALAYGAVKVPISIADFDSASDTTSYAYEEPPGGTITSSPISTASGIK